MIKKEHEVASSGNVFIIQATCSGNKRGKALASQWRPAEHPGRDYRLTDVYGDPATRILA